jgi:hypothetical protein
MRSKTFRPPRKPAWSSGHDSYFLGAPKPFKIARTTVNNFGLLISRDRSIGRRHPDDQHYLGEGIGKND